MVRFLLPSPGFFFCASGQAKNEVLVPSFGFLWVVFIFMTPPPPNFFSFRGISVGALSESKIPKIGGHVRKSQNWVPFC
jgi:hypothetical protein